MSSTLATKETITDIRALLLKELCTKSVILADHETTWSTKGRVCNWLLDTRVLLLNPTVLRWIARMFWAQMLDGENASFQLACLEMTGIPLMIGIQAYGLQIGKEVNGVIIRKERKMSGRLRSLEGELNALPIVFLDDILNSGESVEKASSVLNAEGASISTVWALIDYGNFLGRTRVKKVTSDIRIVYLLRELGVEISLPSQIPLPNIFQPVWHRKNWDKKYYHIVPKSTPVLDEDKIYFGTDSGEFFSLRQEDGTVAWSLETSRRTTKGIWSSPILTERDVIFGAYDGNVYAVDRNSGKIHWLFSEADWVGSSPCSLHDLGLIVVGLEFSLPSQQGSVIALDQDTGQRVWEFPVVKHVHSSPLYARQHQAILVGSNDNEFMCLDAATGYLRWVFNLTREVKSRAAFVENEGLAIFGCFDHCIYALHITTGKLAWKVRTEGIIYSEPLVLEQRVYVTSTDKCMYVLDVRTGHVLNIFETSGKLFSSPSRIKGCIYLGTNAGLVLEYDPEQELFSGRYQLPERVTNNVVYGEKTNLFFVSTNDCQLFALRRLDP